MAQYTLENLDSVGVWILSGPDSYAHYNFVREDHPCVRMMRDVVPHSNLECVCAPITTFPAEREVLRWFKVPKPYFDNALNGIRSLGAALKVPYVS